MLFYLEEDKGFLDSLTAINKRLAGQTTNPDKCDAVTRPACVYLMLAVVDFLWDFYQKW